VTEPTATIVAVHGFTGHPRDFDVVAELVPNVAWITPTMPGHDGYTPKNRECNLEASADRVEAAMATARQRARPTFLLGYSMGARVVLHALCRKPIEGLDGIVLISATAGIDDPAEREERREADDALARRIEHVGTAAFLEEWRRTPIIATHNRIPSPWRAAIEANRAGHDAAGLAASLRGTGTGRMAPLWNELSRLNTRTLVAWGEDDRKFAAHGERLVASLPLAQGCAIAGAGHAAHLEAPRSFADALASFIGC
jgi:2-succinyl-6-hydroxy-2,4-cyclohexadiene-1-carboxylate synthase